MRSNTRNASWYRPVVEITLDHSCCGSVCAAVYPTFPESDDICVDCDSEPVYAPYSFAECHALNADFLSSHSIGYDRQHGVWHDRLRQASHSPPRRHQASRLPRSTSPSTASDARAVIIFNRTISRSYTEVFRLIPLILLRLNLVVSLGIVWNLTRIRVG